MRMNTQLGLAALCALFFLTPAVAQSTQSQGAQVKMKDVRYVVLHRPGPAWMAGKSMFEQPGVRAHVEHYRTWLESGKLQLGGPHLDGAGGGMMIPSAGVQEADVQAFAAADPAVKDGTLVAEVRPWLIGMSQ
jgi:uncharacterized protein YciI